MIQIRTMKQVASSRTIPSFRSCRRLTQADQGQRFDQGRMVMGRTQALTQDARRQWLNSVWRSRP